MTQLISFKEEVNLEDYICLLPSVSVGNVPQLTVDLCITTFKMKRVATIWHPAIVPFVSSDPYFNTSEVYTACELFANKELKIVVMQLRSTLEPKFALGFFRELKNEMEKLRLSKIIILTSVFDYELHNVNSDKFFCIGSHINIFEGFNNMKKLQKSSTGTYYLNGGGFAVKLYEILNNNQCFVIGKYVSEGDNRPDAHALLLKILSILGIHDQNLEIVHPVSWQYVFGGPPPEGIY